MCFERQPSGEIQAIAYPWQEGGLVLAKKTLKATSGYSVTSHNEQRITAGRYTHTHLCTTLYSLNSHNFYSGGQILMIL